MRPMAEPDPRPRPSRVRPAAPALSDLCSSSWCRLSLVATSLYDPPGRDFSGYEMT